MRTCRFPSSLSDGQEIQLVVGLGNPGLDYAKTRHNVGFMVLDLLAKRRGFHFAKSRYGLVASHNGCWFLKPLTYMNLSGHAVRPMMRWHRWSSSQILVVADDMDLPLGRIRLRTSGSSGGHNGLKSIIQEIGTENFSRLKIGIDRPPGDVGVIDWVLRRFTGDEWPILTETLERGADAVTAALDMGMERAMSQFNR